MHSFSNTFNAFNLALILLIFFMSQFWSWSFVSEGTFLCNPNLSVQKELNLGLICKYSRISYSNLSCCYSTTSSPPSLTDDESTYSNDRDSEEVTPENLANRYQEDPEGLQSRIDRFRDDISVDYVQRSRDLESRGLDSGRAREDWLRSEEYLQERQNLRDERDSSLKGISDLHSATQKIIDSRVPETDYEDWTTGRNSPVSQQDDNLAIGGNSPVSEHNSSKELDKELPSSYPETETEKSSSKRSLEEAGESSNDSANKRPKAEDSSSSTNLESSSTSTTESRFKQDSSDVMPDSEPLDFDDPTG